MRFMHVLQNAYIYIYIHLFLHACGYEYCAVKYMCKHRCTYAYIHIYIHTYTYMHVCIYTGTHMHPYFDGYFVDACLELSNEKNVSIVCT
jgi:hypothetical protein